MGIVYILTLLIMMILHILIFKKEEKLNILKWVTINIMLILTYNIFLCVIMSFIKIPITLTNLSFVNVCFIIILGLKLFKDKKIQKYQIHKLDIFVIIIMIIITILVASKFYGIPLDLKNSITDGAVHYYTAEEFYRSSKLLEKDLEIFNFWNLSTFMPGAYINTGIIFKVFAGIVDEIYFCKL